jgi:TetR/AcrR family transcriptional repressor of nem operon
MIDPRRRILNSAAQLIHARSYQDVGVQTICEHADVKKGSFYHFYESKQALMLAVIDELWEAMEKSILIPAFDESLSPRERVEALFRAACEAHTEIAKHSGRTLGCPFGNLAAEASTLDEALRLRLDKVFQSWAGYIEGALREAHANGEIRGGIDPKSASWGLFATLQGSILLSKIQNNAGVIGEIGAGVVDDLWGGKPSV